MKRIRIPSEWRQSHGWHEGARGTADFKLGLGPCGKIVTALAGWWDNGLYCVEQICEDGERKIFRYPVHTITGRIEETF